MQSKQRAADSVAGATSWPAVGEEGPSLSAQLGEQPLSAIRKIAAERFPHVTAVAARGGEGTAERRWSHAELDRLIARWAARLAHEGVTAGTRVGLCAAAEVEVPVGFLAILETGGVVVPLDPALPSARLRSMADAVGCRLVLTSRSTTTAINGTDRLNLSDDPGGYPAAATPADPERVALIYHTSGSTGRPKPVAISHRALSARMRSMIEWFGFGPDEVACGSSSLAFDPFLQQLFFPLCSGGTLWLPERMTLLDPARFWSEAAEQGVTHLNLVPSQLDPLLRRAPAAGLPSLRRIVIGGERMAQDLPARVAAALGAVAVYNMYGPTEATVDATGCRVDAAAGEKEITIGTPLPGVRVRILNEQLERVADGAAGELCIGGAGLAVGYLGMEQATAEAFIADPYGAPGERLYRSGDLARWTRDGQIAFIGRRDSQVKIRGQRIELGEVEAALESCPGVTGAATVLWKEAPGGAALVAHYTGECDPDELRGWLAERLAPAAVPAYLQRADRLPQLPSGKIDRGALPAPAPAAIGAHGSQTGNAAPLESAIGAVWSGILGRPVDVEANLFEAGAHSLHVPQALIGIEQATGRRASAVDLFRFPTISALARHLAGVAGPARHKSQRAAASGDVAIVGMALRFPGASDPAGFWRALSEGADQVRRPDAAALAEAGAPEALVQHPDFVAAHAGIDGTDHFDPLPFCYSPGEAAAIEPQQRLLLELAWHALEDAACDPASDGPVGVFAGVGFNSYLVDNLRERLSFAGSPDRFAVVAGADKDFAATRIAYKLGLTGPAMTVTSACSTALSATATAVDSLRAGRCRVALAGAASLGMFSPFGHVYAEGGIASRSGICRPYDADSDGVVAGAGAAVLVLKRLEDATADGDRVYAVVRGVGVSNDGSRRAAFSAPSVDGQVDAISGALEDAGVEPGDIGFVEGHGTGTQLGDPIEIAALNVAYHGAAPGTILLGSVKGNVGHLDAAAGMAGLIKAALAVGEGMVPPTAHFNAPNPRIAFGEGPFHVNAAVEAWPGEAGRVRLAGVSAFGMGGTNVHLIVGQAPPVAEEAPSAGPVLLTLSAATATARERLAGSVAEGLNGSLAGASAALARRRPLRFRRAVVAASATEAAAALCAPKPLDGEATGGSVPVALLFPGQGAQQAGMARALYHALPVFRQVIDESARLLEGSGAEDVISLLLAEAGNAAATARLSETSRTQPALFITEYAIARAFEAFGIRPAAMIGHSIGEYTAAALAGVMSFADALRLVVLRGRLMESAPRGAMLAVSLPEAELVPLLERCGADLAAVNGPRQCVASGTAEQIAALSEAAQALRGQTHRLAVSHAFHSALMEPVLDQFTAEAARIRLSPPVIPIISNVSGDWLRPEEATDPAYWARHLRGTVRFAAGLRKLTADPRQVLVEAGPGAALSRLARGAGVLEGRAIAAQPSDEADGHAALLRALGRLWVVGAPVDRVSAAGATRRRASLPGYPFERVRLWIEPVAAKGAPTAPARTAERAAEAVPAGDTMAVVAAVWQEVLGVVDTHPDADFLALGGDSLIAVRIAAMLRERLRRDVKPGDLFNGGTLAGLARLIDAVGVATEPAPVGVREEGWL